MTAHSSKFWNRFADRYSRKPVSDPAAYQRKLEKTREYFTRESRVLELGCGTGSTSLAHAPYVSEIMATDYSNRMIEIAKHKASKEGIQNVHFEVANANHAHGFDSDGTYDVIMAHSLIHLLDRPHAIVPTVFTKLREGGVFIQNTPVLGEKKAFLKPIFKLAKLLRLLPKISVLKIDDLTSVLSSAGFDIEYIVFYSSADAIFIVARKPLKMTD